MNYTEKTPSYNDRRYGKPWMAIITTSMTKDFTFLDWDGRPGYAGEFSFSAEPGTLLAYGQKDIRKGRGGVDGYQMCMPDGTLPTVGDATARDLRKLPLAERAAALAVVVIAKAEAEIVELEPKAAEKFYADKITAARERIAKWSAYLPAPVNVAPVDMAGFGFEVTA